MNHKAPSEGGCWYCNSDAEPLAFSCEFDTNLHLSCLEQAFEENPNDPEVQVFVAELGAPPYDG